MRRCRSFARGFTLTELMAVVAILAVLSTAAIAGYARYARQAHVSEAFNMLGMIRMRQESYHAEFSQYCDVAGNDGTTGALGSFFPDSAPGPSPVPWTGNAAIAARWRQLGVNPTGMVYYRYDSPAGHAGVAPAFAGGLGYTSLANQGAWWAAHAYGNLDGDAVQSTFEASSMTDRVWISPDSAE